jgi:hypothetical protein
MAIKKNTYKIRMYTSIPTFTVYAHKYIYIQTYISTDTSLDP